MKPPQTEYALGSRLLRKGTEGNDVKQLQNIFCGWATACRSTERTATLARRPKQSVRASRRDERLEVDGKYGEKSHAALMDAIEAEDEDTPEQPAQPEDGEEENEGEKPVGTHVVIVSDGGKVNIRVGNGTQYGRVTQLAPGTTLDYAGHRQQRLARRKWSMRGWVGFPENTAR